MFWVAFDGAGACRRTLRHALQWQSSSPIPGLPAHQQGRPPPYWLRLWSACSARSHFPPAGAVQGCTLSAQMSSPFLCGSSFRPLLLCCQAVKSPHFQWNRSRAFWQPPSAPTSWDCADAVCVCVWCLPAACRDTTEGFLQGTLPGWDFGTRKGGRPGLGNGRDTIKGVGPAADRYTTLKSLTAAMGGTVKSSAHPGSDIRPLRDLTQQMAAEAGGTVRAVNPPDAHINGGPAAAAGRTLVGGTPTRSDGGAGTGTTSATSSAGQGVVNMMTWTSKQPGASGSSSARPSGGATKLPCFLWVEMA